MGAIAKASFQKIRAAKTLIEEHYDEIRSAWQTHFGC